MWLVKYQYYDDFAYDSVWHDKELAEKRAQKLIDETPRQSRRYCPWEVEEIELGDPLE